MTLARIRLNTKTQPAQIDDVTMQIEAGESFEVLAGELGYDDGGLWESFETGPGGITDIEVSPAMKAALAGLEEGDTSAPFELGAGTLWLHVVSFEQPPARSIYDTDVQLRLGNVIRNTRRQMEWDRYIQSLLQEGIPDDLEDMADRLFRIAISRYAR